MYKHYAQISKNNVVLEYPVNPRVWDISRDDYNVPPYWEGGELNGKTYVFCHNFEPAYQYDEQLFEKTPAINPENGLWYRSYDIVKVSAEVLEERKQMAVQGAQNLKRILLQQYAEMSSIISGLPDSEKQKWQEYQQSIINIESCPEYPFSLNILPRPNESHQIKLQVTRL